MRLKKINASLGLLSILLGLIHLCYSVVSYLFFFYNPLLKNLTAYPFMVTVCLHAVLGMMSVFLLKDGTRLNMYPAQNRGTIIQRVSAALMIPLLILHINTFNLINKSAAAGNIIAFILLVIAQVGFFGVVLSHISVSFTRGLLTLGMITSVETRDRIDRVVYVVNGILFVIASFVVTKGDISLYMMAGGQ